jgi:uncharacterized membrane protein YgdD (TMEM256/DUF423 family)
VKKSDAMNASLALRLTAALGFLAVALGAFGAHGLKDLLARNDTADIWEKAVLYHFLHVIVMLLLAYREPFARRAWMFFFAGVMIFSGSLYILAFTGIKWLGAITPVGGLAMLAGWLLLAIGPGKR